MPGCDGAGTAKKSYPASEVRGGGRQEQLHIQEAVAVRAQEGPEEPSQLKVRKSGGRRYPSSKIRSSGCALLEQP